MTWTVPILLLQSLLSIPPLGYVKTTLGLAPLYGMRSNFVLGEPLPDVQSAVRRHGVDFLKLRSEIRIFNGREHRIPVAGGVAFFAVNAEYETLYVWVPDSSELIRWKAGEVYRVVLPRVETDTIAFAFTEPDRLQIFFRVAQGITASTYDAGSLHLIETSTVPNIAGIAIDTNRNRWTAAGPNVNCGSRQWNLESQVTALEPLDQGWVLVSTQAGVWAARCESEELSAIPHPEFQQ